MINVISFYFLGVVVAFFYFILIDLFDCINDKIT